MAGEGEGQPADGVGEVGAEVVGPRRPRRGEEEQDRERRPGGRREPIGEPRERPEADRDLGQGDQDPDGDRERLAEVDEGADGRDPRELDQLGLDRRRVGGVEECRVQELVEARVDERDPQEEPEGQERNRGDARRRSAPKGSRGRRAVGPRGPPASIVAVPPLQSAPGRSAPGRVPPAPRSGALRPRARRRRGCRSPGPSARSVVADSSTNQVHALHCLTPGRVPGRPTIASARYAGHESWMCVSPSAGRARGGDAVRLGRTATRCGSAAAGQPARRLSAPARPAGAVGRTGSTWILPT